MASFSSPYQRNNIGRQQPLGNLATWCECGEITLPPYFCPPHHNNVAAAGYLSVPNSMVMPAASCVHDRIEFPGSITERLGISSDTLLLPTYFPGINFAAFCSMNAGLEGTDQCKRLLQGDQYYCNSDLVSDFSPSYLVANDIDFELFKERRAREREVVEESRMKVAGRYTVEERKDKIMKYLKKRNQRNFNKTVKYACRKTLADKRIRVRGRFAKNNIEPYCEVEVELEDKTLRSMCHSEEPEMELFNDCHAEMKQDYQETEDWLQEVMATLMYSPLYMS